MKSVAVIYYKSRSGKCAETVERLEEYSLSS